MWLPMPDSLQESIPPSHPTFNPPCPCQNHCPCHLPQHHHPKMIPKVPPQSLLTLRMVTPLKISVVAPKLSSFHLIYLFSLFWFIQLT